MIWSEVELRPAAVSIACRFTIDNCSSPGQHGDPRMNIALIAVLTKDIPTGLRRGPQGSNLYVRFLNVPESDNGSWLMLSLKRVASITSIGSIVGSPSHVDYHYGYLCNGD